MTSLSSKVNERAMANIMGKLVAIKKAAAKPLTLTIGIHEREGSRQKLNYKFKRRSVTLVEVANFHEFGTRLVRERSWLRTWFDKTRYKKAISLMKIGRALVERGPAQAAFDLAEMGRDWVAELAEGIRSESAGLRPLKPKTIKLKEAGGTPIRIRKNKSGGVSASGGMPLQQPETPLVATKQLIEGLKAKVNGKYVD